MWVRRCPPVSPSRPAGTDIPATIGRTSCVRVVECPRGPSNGPLVDNDIRCWHDGAMLDQRSGWGPRSRVSSTHVLVALVVVGLVTRSWLSSLVGATDRLQTAVTVFAGVFVQAVPFLVFGVLVSGAIAALVSPAVLRKVLPRNEPAAIGVAGLAGMALPGCECGAVPVARRLIEQGAPSSVALAFLLSAPAANPVVLVSTAVAFPGEPGMVAARLAGSLATAVVMGLLWSRFGSQAGCCRAGVIVPAWSGVPAGRPSPRRPVTISSRPGRSSYSAQRQRQPCTCSSRRPGTNGLLGRCCWRSWYSPCWPSYSRCARRPMPSSRRVCPRYRCYRAWYSSWSGPRWM